jgi:hypothetical protein
MAMGAAPRASHTAIVEPIINDTVNLDGFSGCWHAGET